MSGQVRNDARSGDALLRIENGSFAYKSGPQILKDINIELEPGEILAVLATGAYNYSMAMNYNRVPRAPVVGLSGGVDRLWIKRESYDDLIKNDI